MKPFLLWLVEEVIGLAGGRYPDFGLHIEMLSHCYLFINSLQCPSCIDRLSKHNSRKLMQTTQFHMSNCFMFPEVSYDPAR